MPTIRRLSGRKPVEGAEERRTGVFLKREAGDDADENGRMWRIRGDFITPRCRVVGAIPPAASNRGDDRGLHGGKAVCTTVCTFGFHMQKRLQCLRAVGLRPDSRHRRMRSYAPYALPLKGKALKKP